MKASKNRGFTLIELIIVISILGILAFLVIPNIVAISSRNTLNTVTKEIAQEIKNTQQLAINRKITVLFDLDTQKNTYRVRENKTPAIVFKTGQLSKDIKITSNLYAPYSGHLSGVRRISYTPNGLPSRTGTIWLIDQNGNTKRITIAVGTGRVKIIE